MAKDELYVEGERAPGPYRVMINHVVQEGGYPTLEEARASVKRLDVYVEIWKGRERVWGKPPPELPPRKPPKRRRRR